MADDTAAARAVRALGRRVRITPGLLAGSMSGSGVYRVEVDGGAAVLKVTDASGEGDNARRELAFYRTLAEQVPVRTPRLLDYADDADLTALLLSAHTPAPPAREWDRSTWLAVASQLAALHTFRVSDDEPWLKRIRRDRLDQRPLSVAEEFWSRTAAAASMPAALGCLAELGRAIAAAPDCFTHGDCHAGNFLLDGSELVWTDWQVTGIGKAAMDLAFLWSRADADSADPPYDAMVREYVDRSGTDPVMLRRVLIAVELETLLFDWPMYAHYHPPHERDRLARRLIQLVDDWNRLDT